ncbi:MAG: phosphoribosylformylglycinamidine synthase subunit PurQ [Rhizobiaceae bacterium]
MQRTTIVQFPGSNRDRDMIAAIAKISGVASTLAWHTDTSLPDSDLIIIPGGFSHGDYLRSGAIAARAPVMKAIASAAKKGVRILGVCNGFQTLTESGLLPGALMRNARLTFVCKEVKLQIANNRNPFTEGYGLDEVIRCPVAHHDGNYFADEKTLKALEDNGQVAFRYAQGTNPNGSIHDIAGIFNKRGNILGMMPHPENLIEPAHGGEDGRRLFEGALNLLETEPA